MLTDLAEIVGSTVGVNVANCSLFYSLSSEIQSYKHPYSSQGTRIREVSLHVHYLHRMREKIGEGAFSSVSKGSWTRMGRSYDVAVKSLLKNSTEIDKIKLLQEAAIMGQFQHPNIVKLFGVIKLGNSVSWDYIILKI